MDYLDFELEILPGSGGNYPVAVLRSPAGEARAIMHFPFDEITLKAHLDRLQYALWRSAETHRHDSSGEEDPVQIFGENLFGALFNKEMYNCYMVSRVEADRRGKGLRLKLRILDPKLATLPWEYMYDPQQAEYMCLSRRTPLVRYLELPQPSQALDIAPPLRILGMISSPSDLPSLNASSERERIEQAIAALRKRNMVTLTWLEGQTSRELHRAMRGGPWHVFHFIGHGYFNIESNEGGIVLADENGRAHTLQATQLGRLLADHRSLRLVILSTCEGARGDEQSIFSSVASRLVQRGLPAVLAMQYAMTEIAMIEFARVFYESLSDDLPVDAAVAEARKAVSLEVEDTLEWGIPVLHMRTASGVIWQLADSTSKSEPRQEVPTRISSPSADTNRTTEWDVFICHASEDKSTIARPLVEALEAEGLRVWYDEFTLTAGDSLRQAIDQGLAGCRYGIVILSPNFFAKEWPQRELDGLVQREMDGKKVILPVWHNITAAQVSKHAPTLGNRVAILSELGLPRMVSELMRAMSPTSVESGVVHAPSSEAPHIRLEFEAALAFALGLRPPSIQEILTETANWEYRCRNEPDDADLRQKLGYRLFFFGDPKRSREHYMAARRISPKPGGFRRGWILAASLAMDDVATAKAILAEVHRGGQFQYVDGRYYLSIYDAWCNYLSGGTSAWNSLIDQCLDKSIPDDIHSVPHVYYELAAGLAATGQLKHAWLALNRSDNLDARWQLNMCGFMCLPSFRLLRVHPHYGPRLETWFDYRKDRFMLPPARELQVIVEEWRRRQRPA